MREPSNHEKQAAAQRAAQRKNEVIALMHLLSEDDRASVIAIFAAKKPKAMKRG